MLPHPLCVLILDSLFVATAWGWVNDRSGAVGQRHNSEPLLRSGWSLTLLSDSFMENDLVAVRFDDCGESGAKENDDAQATIGSSRLRLCVVRPDGGIHPLCTHEDDVQTDLFIDPRVAAQSWTDDVEDGDIFGRFGEGWYGQRPVPSLGGGPGYGAEADEIWSIDEELLEKLKEDCVEVPMLDVGIAHGEKARGGAF